jgi:ADP-ribose pyrophosphatase
MSYSILHEETVYQGKVFDLARIRFKLPNGKEPVFEIVKHHGAVTVLPIDDQGNVWFIRQFRLGAGQELLELPAGLLEEGESAEHSAAREVQEEIGMAAGRLQRLGEFYMVPGYSTEKLEIYLATDLYPSVLPTDEFELLEKVVVPVAEALRMARAGEIKDGKTLATLFLAQPFLDQWMRVQK